MNRKGYKYLFSLGHIASDINQGALPAVLPFLIASYHYDYTTAATLVMVANIVGSLIQPVLGQIADKHNKPWIMIAGIFLAGAGMAALGFMPSFAGMCVAVMISGVGIAMFHPQAAQLVNRVSEEHNRGQNIIYSPMVVLGQLYLPNHMGLASGMTLGLAVSIGGIAAPLLGKFADLHGVIASIYICAAVALIPLVASIFLPKVAAAPAVEKAA